MMQVIEFLIEGILTVEEDNFLDEYMKLIVVILADSVSVALNMELN